MTSAARCTSAVTLSVHDLNGNRIAEHAGAGAVIREYIWLDGRPLAVVEGGQVFWLHWDHILRPVMATDATGAVVWAATYTLFGGIHQVSTNTGALTAIRRSGFRRMSRPPAPTGSAAHGSDGIRSRR
jgi:uncharacterized protein RhaS with RHS repeats